MRHAYVPHANRNQARAQLRAIRRAMRTPNPMRVPNIIAALTLIVCGGLLATLFALLLYTGEYNHEYPQAITVMLLGHFTGLFGFIAGVLMLCITLDHPKRY
jgi:hypothetical protein